MGCVFHDNLYGCKFEVVTDNNPLTNIFTKAKLDVTCQRWVAELSMTFPSSIEVARKDGNADGLSRIPEGT